MSEARSSSFLRPAPVLRLARYTVRRRRLAPLTWGLPLSLMSVFVVAIFPSIENASGIRELVDSYPDALKEAFDFSADSFATIEGYMAAEVFSLIGPLVACAFLIRTVSDAMCGAQARGTLDVLLSAPVTRREIAAGALLGGSVVLVAILVVFAVLTVVAGAIAGVGLAVADVLAGTAALFPLAFFFAGLTLALAGATARSGLVGGVAAGTLLAMYLAEVLGSFSGAIDALRTLSAFHYYGSAIEEGLDVAASAGLIGAGLVLALAGALLFERRDIG